MSDNPYQQLPAANPDQGLVNTRLAKDKVRTPAMLMIVSGIICVLSGVFGGGSMAVIYLGLQDGVLEELENQDEDPGLTPQELRMTMNVLGWMGVGIAVASLIAGAISIVGGVAMMNLKGWGFAFVAAILSLVPFFQGCCLLSIPVGIYAIVVLSDRQVKRAFT